MSFPFFAADTLGMTLFQLTSGLRGSEVRHIHLGPWKIEVVVEAKSDLINPREATFWVKFGKHLNMYLVQRERECWMLILDEAKLKECAAAGFVALSLPHRWREMRSSVRCVYHWRNGGAFWQQQVIDSVKF